MMCQCMKVSKNAYYNWLKFKDIEKVLNSVLFLKKRILHHFEQNRQVYGSARIQKELSKENLNYSRSYISKLMRQMNLRSVLKRKHRVTTDSKHGFPVAKNLLKRKFTSQILGQKWVSDITYIRVNDDWNYLTIMMDLADRKIVGWSLSKDMTTENTTLKAWLSARRSRNVVDGFILHSDRGVQYVAKKFSNHFTYSNRIHQSMSRKGNCWDNAVAESFFKTIKYECLYRYKFTSHTELYTCIDQYMDWYNTKRIHSSLSYRTPLEMEIYLRGYEKAAA